MLAGTPNEEQTSRFALTQLFREFSYPRRDGEERNGAYDDAYAGPKAEDRRRYLRIQDAGRTTCLLVKLQTDF